MDALFQVDTRWRDMFTIVTVLRIMPKTCRNLLTFFHYLFIYLKTILQNVKLVDSILSW